MAKRTSHYLIITAAKPTSTRTAARLINPVESVSCQRSSVRSETPRKETVSRPHQHLLSIRRSADLKREATVTMGLSKRWKTFAEDLNRKKCLLPRLYPPKTVSVSGWHASWHSSVLEVLQYAKIPLCLLPRCAKYLSLLSW